MDNAAKLTQIPVWDLPIRVFHWLIVLLFALLWVSGKFGGMDMSLPLPGGKTLFLTNMDLHMLLGQAVLVLVVFRLLWGVVGSTTARFASFIRSPRAAISYLQAMLRGQTPAAIGHNPAGGLMVVFLLGLLLTQSITGLFANDDIFSEGPLAHLVTGEMSARLTEFHGWLFNLLLVAVALHVTVIVYYLLRGQNLVGAMVTGRKRLSALAATTEPRHLQQASVWLALLLLLLAGLAVWALRWL